MMRAQARR